MIRSRFRERVHIIIILKNRPQKTVVKPTGDFNATSCLYCTSEGIHFGAQVSSGALIVEMQPIVRPMKGFRE